MKSEELYCQCTLQQKRDSGTTRMTYWIPKKYAVLGKFLILNDQFGIWNVVSVYPKQCTREEVIAMDNSYREFADVLRNV